MRSSVDGTSRCPRGGVGVSSVAEDSGKAGSRSDCCLAEVTGGQGRRSSTRRWWNPVVDHCAPPYRCCRWRLLALALPTWKSGNVWECRFRPQGPVVAAFGYLRRIGCGRGGHITLQTNVPKFALFGLGEAV